MQQYIMIILLEVSTSLDICYIFRIWNGRDHVIKLSPYSSPPSRCAPRPQMTQLSAPLALSLPLWASVGKSGNRLERSTTDRHGGVRRDIFADRDETRHICRAEERESREVGRNANRLLLLRVDPVA